MRIMTKNDLLFFLVLIAMFCVIGLWVKSEMKGDDPKPETDNGLIQFESDSIEFTKEPFILENN